MSTTYTELPNMRVTANNGVDYAYRAMGTGPVPLVLFQHFRGNLDAWDPALVDALGASRPVITFDNVGVGGSTGRTPHSVTQMAHDALSFLDALEVDQFDALGFSIGSFVAQEIALIRPLVVRRLVLAASAPRGARGMHGWAPQVIGAVGNRETNPDGFLKVFFTQSDSSRRSGEETLGRLFSRTVDRDEATNWDAVLAQYDAVCEWGVPNHGELERLAGIEVPVFVANGDSDPMILTHYSYLLAGLIPQARVKIYADAAHGFLFQHHTSFAADVDAFLGDPAH
jgi:pimeloyl-ACP methyl ester carboxylesterase